MCLAFPGKIVSIDEQQATVDFDGVKKEINISLVADVKKGDFVIVHAGFAIEKVDRNAKKEIDELIKEND
ncbi:MAG TPA: HypC/HybG/HupF family hydrogenase formation chaperone [Candidatus Moranbacteria bacterium]|nr:HypC/HybG/HupF family hydrogenase formation chaperone [Candidatus Moranbacteria bacterium]